MRWPTNTCSPHPSHIRRRPQGEVDIISEAILMLNKLEIHQFRDIFGVRKLPPSSAAPARNTSSGPNCPTPPPPQLSEYVLKVALKGFQQPDWAEILRCAAPASERLACAVTGWRVDGVVYYQVEARMITGRVLKTQDLRFTDFELLDKLLLRDECKRPHPLPPKGFFRW
jgi:hypothetical protein